MNGVSVPHFVRRHGLIVKTGFIAVAVVAATLVLWLRQTTDATLRVESFRSGSAQVALGALPTIVLYLLLAYAPAMVVVGGFALIGLLVLGWWSYATDWHSTAGLGPGISGWVFGPAVILCAWLLQIWLRQRRTR